MTDADVVFLLVPVEAGVAALTGPADQRRRLRLQGDDWIVEGPCPGTLRRDEDGESLVLIDGSGDEAGRLAPVLGGEDAWPADVLLADGRVFRVALRAGREPRFELRSWETPGAYLVATVRGDGWSIEATPAGRQLGGLEVLVLLVCGGILQTTTG